MIDTLADTDSVLELRRDFGAGHGHRAGRIEGRPLGVVANNPTHLAGAIDADGADKAARFMQLCDAFDLPVLFLCDTPGHHGRPRGREDRDWCATAPRMFVVGANLTRAVLHDRAAQGLRPRRAGDGRRQLQGAVLRVAWPTGEFGGMGLEGAVKLGYRKELAAIDETGRARARSSTRWSRACTSTARRVNMASHFEIDDVIDPADTRRWIATLLDAAPDTHRSATDPTAPPRRPNVDTW